MIYRFGDCLLDTQRYQLQRAGQPVRLRSKGFLILHYLLDQRDRTVRKQEISEQVWPQQFISEATLESTVRAVRQAIGDSGRGQQLIQTIYGYGYRFIAAVEELANLPPEGEDKVPGVRPDAIAASPQAPSDMIPPQSAQEPAIEPDDRNQWGGSTQEGTPLLGDPSQAGEWKLVTILCAAPVTSSGRGDQQDTDTRYRQLARLYAVAQRVVERYGGTIQPVLGNHVLALFGTPVAQEDHAQRAVLAAFELQRRARETDPERGIQPAEELALRVGMYTGQVAVGPIAEDPAGAISLIGTAVSGALALQAQAAPGMILCSAATAHLVQGIVRIAAVAPVPIPGEPAPVAAYTVLRAYQRRAPLNQRDRRAWSPFVGRRRELMTLRSLLTQVEESRGQVVGMIGESGVGKSRLCYEFIRGSLSHRWVILETQGTAYGQPTPYLPVIDLIKGYFRINERDDPPTVREKVTARLRDFDDTLISTAPALLALLDVLVEDPTWQALEGPQRRQRTLDAIKRLLLWESQIQPLLLVIKNLHWIDAETQAMLDTLMESLPAARFFLLATYRPEYQHGWGNKTYYTQLRLDPLPRESALELVNGLLGDDATLAALKQLLIERTEGNPFFLEENVRTLVEIQALIGEPGAYRLAQALPSIQMLVTVQAVLAARIDRLPPEEKRLLQTAAVIGTEVPFSLLQTVAELPEERLLAGLAHLQGAEFLYETSLFPELAYTCKHALTQEVAYGSLLQDHRLAIHARIVGTIETLYAERLAEQVERLAHHAFRGEMWDKALMYLRQAGDKAYDRGAFREAMIGYEKPSTRSGTSPSAPTPGC
jgi:DNA-binding winged helix-turn-helix (wHTH) protein/class 3 adenylate cyclase